MDVPIKCVTWNVNSVRARLDRVTLFLDAHRPDVVCLQELKCTIHDYPGVAFEALGYQSVLNGQKSWNGVAILSRTPATAVDKGLDEQARVIAGTVQGIRFINVYVPNGAPIGSSKYRYKLRWLAQLEDFLADQERHYGEFVLLGDFNVIIMDMDAAHPARWAESVLCDPPTRDALGRLRERFHLKDVLREYAPGPGVYTWWDYRARSFEYNIGVRIDHILMTSSLAKRTVHAWVDTAERGLERPSDHAPVLARLLTRESAATP